MTDTGGVTTTTGVQAPTAPRKRRGREGVTDMVRSLGIVMMLVVSLWFFGQASPSDRHPLRVVDARSQYTDFTRAHPGVPVPATPPAGWITNVATYDATTQLLRVGYVISRTAYTEFAAGAGPSFIADQTGRGATVGPLTIAGVVWQHVRSADERDALVREVRGVSLVVGGVREKASLAELSQLAAAVR